MTDNTNITETGKPEEAASIPDVSAGKAASVQHKKTSIGGQALIEGLMMVGPTRTAMAIRKADGSILVEEIPRGQKTAFFEKVPFFRGAIRLFRQLVTGTGALMKSADFSEDAADGTKTAEKKLPEPISETTVTTEPISETTVTAEPVSEPAAAPELVEAVSEPAVTEEPVEDASEPIPAEPIPAEPAEDTLHKIADEARSAALPSEPKEKMSRMDSFIDKNMNVMIVFSAILGILFSVVLFILLPRAIVDFISNWIPASQTDNVGVTLILNLVEGILRIAIFIAYLAITSRMKEIARVWMYHGAEHKTISCYEAGEPLTVENIRKYSRFHPRCGTAFLFIVVIVSILVFCVAGVFIGVNIWWLNMLIRLALVPLVAGIAYEIIHFTGKHDSNPICRSVSKPGMWMQRFTTREPDDRMIEVAIAAMEAVLPENKDEDNW